MQVMRVNPLSKATNKLLASGDISLVKKSGDDAISFIVRNRYSPSASQLKITISQAELELLLEQFNPQQAASP